jgi:serine phosphatase RsbU (regulator of sigma subunit)/anti-sigma regulatory factor (Ser/Thr protein kinase)/anti-anti-sigma regulatory factor
MNRARGPGRPVGDVHVVRDAFDALPVAAAALEGPDHIMVAANAAYARLVGRSFLVGRTIREIFPEVVGQQVFEVLDDAYASGRPQLFREWRIQLDRAGDGTLSDAFIDFAVVPWRRADGSVRGLVATVIDKTEQVLERRRAARSAGEAAHWYAAARDVVTELQRTLLPTGLPVLPGARIAATYLVAAQDQAAGGDWFDAVPRQDGTAALVVGDVVGHGVAASGAMGQLRAVLNELLTEGLRLEEVLASADRLAARVPAMRAATACIALLDPATGALEYATCGHPPPLLVRPDGAARYLPASGAGPLGTGGSAACRTDTVAPGEVLLIYSDGLIERPERSLDEGMAALAQVAGAAAANRVLPHGAPSSAAERVCGLSVELLTRTGYSDDVTVLAVERRVIPVTPMHLDVRRDPANLAGVRAALREWLAALGTADEDEDALQLAVSELVANAIEHAYAERPDGIVRVDAELSADGCVELRVADDGEWREPKPPSGRAGRGLWMITAFVDDLTIDHPGGSGTTVTVRQRLQHSATLATDPGGAPLATAKSADFGVVVADDSPRRVGVAGPIDITTVGQLSDALRTASRGGLHPVTVTLSDVTLLASAGVRSLHELRDQLAAHGHELVLVAPSGSPAAAVLDLVGLPREQSANGPS